MGVEVEDFLSPVRIKKVLTFGAQDLLTSCCLVVIDGIVAIVVGTLDQRWNGTRR